jgi:AcrR family transcriptional regulator
MPIQSGASMNFPGDPLLSERQQELKNKYLIHLQPAIIRHGLSRLKIDDIVRFMGISKATFYKYFSSKEDVIRQGIDLTVSYFKQAEALILDESTSLLLRFQHTFTQSLIIASFLPDTFLLDLKQTYPALWERFKQAQQIWQQRLERFYKQGIEQDIFHPINPIIAVLQHDLLLRTMMDPSFLMEHDTTLKTLLYDYYESQKYQWLPSEMANQLDDMFVKEYIDKLVRSISLGMQIGSFDEC